MKKPKGELIAVINCSKEYGSGQYFTFGDSRVVTTRIGKYREAEDKAWSRFGYRFAVKNTGVPHLAVIRYPDDKRRFMCVMDGTCYDLTTGVFNGIAQPVSRKMQEIRQVFWPRWKDCSVTFMTWGQGEPAAVERVEIYELEGLPALGVPGDPGDGPMREFGIQYEDPCGTGASEGAMSHKEWEERVIAYSRHSGQKLFVYPICWYHGPQFPSAEPSDAFDMVVARDRKSYSRWTTHPEDWLSGMLERFGEEGLEFRGGLTFLRLGSLMKKMNTDLNSIKAGADTINNMLWNDNVQSGTQDWTILYNARNYSRYVEFHEAGGDMKDFPWAYGEKENQPYHPGPIFNPLHPVVQEAILGFVKEIVAKYGKFPAFKGISFNMWQSTFLWFGSIHSGYDDCTVGLFEKETGINVPVDAKAPDRFSKRYQFLAYVCRPAWVSWRCEKVRQLFRMIRDTLAETRPDLNVTFTFWNEMTIPALLGPIGSSHQLGARLSNYDLYREAGFDLGLFQNEPGIEIDLQLEPERDSNNWSTAGKAAPLEKTTMFRDFDFLDRKTLDSVKSLPGSGIFIFNSWVEAWGQHKWFSAEPGDANVSELSVMCGKPAEGICRINSIYPEDGFWWDSQLRIVPPFQGGVHFLEHYAHAVAEFDACRITRGGLFLDKAHTEEIRCFAKAYRALPKEKFTTVGASADPVAVRTLTRDNRRYVYAVNREYYPVKVEISLKGKLSAITDLASGRAVRAGRRWKITLGPYELRSFALGSKTGVSGFIAIPPSKIANALLKEGRRAVSELQALRESGRFIPGMDEMEKDILFSISEGRLAWLRRALSSYIVLKCKEMLTTN